MIFERPQSGKQKFGRDLLRLRSAVIDSRFFAAFALRPVPFATLRILASLRETENSS